LIAISCQLSAKKVVHKHQPHSQIDLFPYQ
jgi:hypothetical protein